MKFKLTIIICLIALYLPLTATAETSAEFIHYPPATWSAGNQLEISARVDKDWTAEKIWVAVRQRGASESFQTFPMKRTNENMFTALIPRQIVQPAGLEYYIASKNKQGTKTTQFASAKDHSPSWSVAKPKKHASGNASKDTTATARPFDCEVKQPCLEAVSSKPTESASRVPTTRSRRRPNRTATGSHL